MRPKIGETRWSRTTRTEVRDLQSPPLLLTEYRPENHRWVWTNHNNQTKLHTQRLQQKPIHMSNIKNQKSNLTNGPRIIAVSRGSPSADPNPTYIYTTKNPPFGWVSIKKLDANPSLTITIINGMSFKIFRYIRFHT